MSRRRLSKQQERQIKKTQADYIDGSDNLEKGLVIAHFGKKVLVKLEDKTSPVECHIRQNLGAIVCGDHVYCEKAPLAYSIVGIIKRKTILGRTNKSGQMKPLAANIDQILIVSAHLPPLSTYLIDSYLVAAHSLGIDACLLLNKCDLIKPQSTEEVVMAYYTSLGYPVLKVSAKNQVNMAALEHATCHKTQVLVGQSGVGKSTLINALIPDADSETQTLSNHLGTHTTTTSVLHFLPRGGAIIDSPGVREFGLGHLSMEAILSGFIDLARFRGQCKYRNCRHINEPDCQLLLEVKQGRIPPYRMENYHRILKQFGHDA